MNEIMHGAGIGATAGVVGGGLALLLFALLIPVKRCPDCGTPLPKFGRKHARPGLWGGWICPGCGCEVDRKGNKVASKGMKNVV